MWWSLKIRPLNVNYMTANTNYMQTSAGPFLGLDCVIPPSSEISLKLQTGKITHTREVGTLSFFKTLTKLLIDAQCQKHVHYSINIIDAYYHLHSTNQVIFKVNIKTGFREFWSTYSQDNSQPYIK